MVVAWVMLGLTQIAQRCKLLMFVALPDLGLGLMSPSLPGHLQKGLGDGGKDSTLQKRWLT
jgi:hypothetical protein